MTKTIDQYNLDEIVLGKRYIEQQKEILKYLAQFDNVITEAEIAESLDLTVILVKTHLDDMRHQGLSSVCGTWHWRITELGKEYVEKKL